MPIERIANKVEARCISQILSGRLISRATEYSARWLRLGPAWLSLLIGRVAKYPPTAHSWAVLDTCANQC